MRIKRCNVIVVGFLFFIFANNSIFSLGDKSTVNIKGNKNSKILVFQDVTFNFSKKADVEKFIRVIQSQSPKITKQLEKLFNRRINYLRSDVKLGNRKVMKSIENISGLIVKSENQRKSQSKSDATINSQANSIAKLINDKEKLQKEIMQFRQENGGIFAFNEFAKVIDDAQRALDAYDVEKYHAILKDYHDRKDKELKRVQKKLAKPAFMRARQYRDSGNIEAALEQMKLAIHYDGDNEKYLFGIGDIYRAKRDHRKFQKYTELALKKLEIRLESNHPAVAMEWNKFCNFSKSMGKLNSTKLLQKCHNKNAKAD